MREVVLVSKEAAPLDVAQKLKVKTIVRPSVVELATAFTSHYVVVSIKRLQQGQLAFSADPHVGALSSIESGVLVAVEKRRVVATLAASQSHVAGVDEAVEQCLLVRR